MAAPFEILKRSLQDVVDSARVGTPVSVRMNVQLATPADELQYAACALELASTILPMDSGHFHVHRSRLGNQCSLLFVCESGPTLSLTTGTHAGATSSLSFVLVGNHGVARLEGDFEPVCTMESLPETSQKWWQRLQKEIKLAAN